MRIQRFVNGNLHVFECSKSAYENFYRHSGYEIVPDVFAEMKNDIPAEKELFSGKNIEDDVSLIPISQWTEEQLLDWANSHEIDTKTPISTLRKKIQKTFEED